MANPILFGRRASPPEPDPPEPDPPAPPPRAPARTATGGERRRAVRIPLALRGRYMLEDSREHPCVTRDVSRLGVAIGGVPVGALGERVVAYLEAIGRIEGRVVRRSEDWFAIELVASPQKRDRLEQKISVLLRRAAATGAG